MSNRHRVHFKCPKQLVFSAVEIETSCNVTSYISPISIVFHFVHLPELPFPCHTSLLQLNVLHVTDIDIFRPPEIWKPLPMFWGVPRFVRTANSTKLRFFFTTWNWLVHRNAEVSHWCEWGRGLLLKVKHRPIPETGPDVSNLTKSVALDPRLSESSSLLFRPFGWVIRLGGNALVSS